MYWVTISAIAEKKSCKDFEQRLEDLSLRWKYSFFMGNPSKDSEGKYQTIAKFQFPNPLIPEIIDLIQKSSLGKVWYEYEDENGSIGVKEFISGNEEYSMCGSKEISEDGSIIDVYCQVCDDFSKKCAERTDDMVVDITDDQQLHIRKYEGEKLILAIDGNIEKDNRIGDRDYWLSIP